MLASLHVGGRWRCTATTTIPTRVPLSFAASTTASSSSTPLRAGPQARRPRAQRRRHRFCAIAADDIVPSKFTTHFRSVIVFGKARAGHRRRREEARPECASPRSTRPEYLDAADSEIDGDWKRVCVIELAIEHMTGKASIELVRKPHVDSSHAECALARGPGRLGGELWRTMIASEDKRSARHRAGHDPQRGVDRPGHLPPVVLGHRHRRGARLRPHRPGGHPRYDPGEGLRRVVRRAERVHVDVRHGAQRGRHHAEPRLLLRRGRPHRRRGPEGRGGHPARRDPAEAADAAARPRQHPRRGVHRRRPGAVPRSRGSSA